MKEGLADTEARWVLTQQALDKLLKALDSDREEASKKYERIRYKLIRLFQWRGSTIPEELADETFNRVARRLDEGLEIRSKDSYRFFSGVAYRVFQEVVRQQEREQKALRRAQGRASQAVDGEPWEPSDTAEERLTCLRRCLATLPAENRQLVLNYHRGEKRERIPLRRSVAQDLGISMNTLRLRVHRLQKKLETCVRKCMAEADAEPKTERNR